MLKIVLQTASSRMVAFEYEGSWVMSPEGLARHASEVKVPPTAQFANTTVSLDLYGADPFARMEAARWIIDDYAKMTEGDSYVGVWELHGLPDLPEDPPDVVY